MRNRQSRRVAIKITYDREWDEYRVPELSDSGSVCYDSDVMCFTSNNEVAERIARCMFGKNVKIRHVSVRGKKIW